MTRLTAGFAFVLTLLRPAHDTSIHCRMPNPDAMRKMPSCDLLRHVLKHAVMCMLRSCFASSIISFTAKSVVQTIFVCSSLDKSYLACTAISIVFSAFTRGADQLAREDGWRY